MKRGALGAPFPDGREQLLDVVPAFLVLGEIEAHAFFLFRGTHLGPQSDQLENHDGHDGRPREHRNHANDLNAQLAAVEAAGIGCLGETENDRAQRRLP